MGGPEIPNSNFKWVKSQFQIHIIVQQVRPAPLTFLILWSFCGRVGRMRKYILTKAPSTVLETTGFPVTGGPPMSMSKTVYYHWRSIYHLESAVGNNFSIDKAHFWSKCLGANSELCGARNLLQRYHWTTLSSDWKSSRLQD